MYEILSGKATAKPKANKKAPAVAQVRLGLTSPLPKSRRVRFSAHFSSAPVCLTPSPLLAASREKASPGERAESRGDQETFSGVHLESRREPGAPE